ncbi:hypothetical protein AB5I41_31280 [Sphingomonas sp. MMS24-JH45]
MAIVSSRTDGTRGSISDVSGACKGVRERKKGVAGNVDETFHETAPDTETDTDVPLAKANGPEAETDQVFWTNAKAYLKPEAKNPGALVGKWVRDFGKQAAAEAITRAQLERPAVRVPFIEGCLRKRGAEMAEGPISMTGSPSDARIVLRSHGQGEHRATCPQCSHKQKKTERCLAVLIDADGWAAFATIAIGATEAVDLKKAHADWLDARGIDPTLAQKFGLHTVQRAGRHWLAAPYVEQGRTVDRKYR